MMLTVSRVTDSQIYKSCIAKWYMFVLLHNPGFDEADIQQILDHKIVDHWTVPSVYRLSRSSWELVVYRISAPEIRRKLEHIFPSCCIKLDSNPIAPSKADIGGLGSSPARSNARQDFLARAKEMKESAWPIAQEYYALRMKELLASKKVKSSVHC
jgi:hypothetical protein